jgi:hypothetical protein
MKIAEESTEKSEDDCSELYHFPVDEELKAVLEEEEMDLDENLGFLSDKIRKKLEEIFPED